jgi:hypothetical protein
LGAGPRVFCPAYLALDYNNIMYGMSGMETQLAVAAVLAVAYLFSAFGARPSPL